MRTKKMVLFLLMGLFFATSASAVPKNWGVFVPTGAQYLGSHDGAIGYDWGWHDCNGYDRTGIDHISWHYCIDLCDWCPGYMCSSGNAFDVYQMIGDYYDCDGNLLEEGSPRGIRWAILAGTGTIFGGGIGGGDDYRIIGCSATWCCPARDCQVFEDTSPQLGPKQV